MSSNKRSSMLPPPPKPPTSLSSSVTIPDHASLIGTNLITIHSHTVLHPRAKLNSSFAPITIGSQCIISERSSVGMLHFPSPEQAAGVTMENYVVVEVGAVVEASRIGEGTIIEVNARVGRGAVLGKHCKIGPLCEVADDEVIPDYTVIYGDGLRRIDKSGVEDLKLKMVGRQADVLRKLIPSNLAKYQ
ncbi:transferase hexapeptide domain-containing protein [Rutstroemia sp. NJR-2017a WRK4]|nr:transferase hexapeptide domain-containing protein [Rutstroemia sp. NJR-2017a WRK4]